MTKHPVIFAGAGPGAPDLITVRGAEALKQADLIIYAGSLVPEAVLQWAREGAEITSSASMHLEEMVEKTAAGFDAGKRVVRLHSGDPALYGAIREQMDGLDQLGVPYEVIPGVTAAFAASAALKAEYTIPGISQTLIFTRMAGKTPVPEAEALLALARCKASMAVYLSSNMAGEVAKTLVTAYGSQAPCVVASRVSHPEERIIRATLDQLEAVMQKEKITKHALIIVGAFLETKGGARSLLYDKGFSHEYRSRE